MDESDGQLHTLGVLEQLRAASKSLWGASSQAYFRVEESLRHLANPNLHDIPRNLPFRVEMWDGADQYVRWVIAASASVAVGHAAIDAAIASYPDQRFTLRSGIQVIRQYPGPSFLACADSHRRVLPFRQMTIRLLAGFVR